MSKLNALDWIALILAIIGSINWGLTALGYNVVDGIFGVGSSIGMIIYILVGLAGIYLIFLATKVCRCKSGAATTM